MRFVLALLSFFVFNASAAGLLYEGEGANITYSDNTKEKAFWRNVNANGPLVDVGGNLVSSPPIFPIPKDRSAEISRRICLEEWKWERFFPDEYGGGRCLIRKDVADDRFRARVEQFLKKF
jgi:hypothetical protein